MKLTWVNAFLFLSTIFLASVVITLTGLGSKIEVLDIPLHILGGFGSALLGILIIQYARIPTAPQWFSFLFTIGFVLIIGTVWEFAEFGLELIVPQNSLLTPLTLRDTLADLFNDSVGAAIAWTMFKKI